MAAAGADAAHRDLRVVGERQDVAVAAEPRSQPGGDGQALGAGSHEDLGGPERAGGQNHHVREHERGRGTQAVAPVAGGVEGDDPARAASCGADGADRRLAEDLRSVGDGIGQVVDEHRVLGVVVAPADAVATQGAGILMDACGIDARLERDVDPGAFDRGRSAFGGDRQGRQLDRIRPVLGVRRRAEHPLRAFEVGGERVAATPQLGGPALVVEDPGRRAERHAGVDQRGPAQPTTHHDADLVVGVELEQGGPGPDAAPGCPDLELAQRPPGGVRIVAGAELSAPLEHAYRPAQPGQAGRGDSAAVAAADDHDFVSLAQAVERERQFRLGLLLDHLPQPFLLMPTCPPGPRKWAGPAAGRPTAGVHPPCSPLSRHEFRRNVSDGMARGCSVTHMVPGAAQHPRNAGR